MTTLHESWEAACKEQMHRIVYDHHIDVVVMPVATDSIIFHDSGSVTVYTPGAMGTRKAVHP